MMHNHETMMVVGIPHNDLMAYAYALMFLAVIALYLIPSKERTREMMNEPSMMGFLWVATSHPILMHSKVMEALPIVTHLSLLLMLGALYTLFRVIQVAQWDAKTSL